MPLNNTRIRNNAQSGFSLVELMVAMVLGLIVIGAVIALVLSMMRANNQTIASTRLSQEMRATAALMSADLRRAGGVQDPLTSATSNAGQPDTTLATISTVTAGCIQYSYADAEAGNFHAISLRNGAVWMMAGATAGAATCTGGTQLSSPQVRIVDPDGLVPGLTFSVTGRRIDITLRGCLSNRARTDCDRNPLIRRTYTQSVFVRSVPGT